MPEFPVANYTFADRLENARWISVGISVMGIAYIVRGVLVLGGLNLDLVIGLFLFVGILLHGVPRKFISAFTLAAKGASPILLQYPLYAGIMGMMGGDNPVTGVSLAGYISNFFVSISTETTFPVYAFLSAGIINFFVPSGGVLGLLWLSGHRVLLKVEWSGGSGFRRSAASRNQASAGCSRRAGRSATRGGCGRSLGCARQSPSLPGWRRSG